MPHPDLNLLFDTLSERLLAIDNQLLDPPEPAIRSTFDLFDELVGNDAREGHRLPTIGIIHDEEEWGENELLSGDAVLGVSDVSKVGRQRWRLLLMCDAPRHGGGMRGPRGARHLSTLVMDDLDGWHITPGCPVSVDRRKRYVARGPNGEEVPIAAYEIEISHPADYAG